GIGVRFVEAEDEAPGLAELRCRLDALVGEVAPPAPELPRPVRVVVADERPRLLDRLVSTLGEAGFHVEAAADGVAAYAACLAQPPDVMLASLALPLLGGRALTREVRARHPGVRMVLMAPAPVPRVDGEPGWIGMPFTDD